MLSGQGAIISEQKIINNKISKTSPMTNVKIHIVRIENIYSDRLTVDVFLPEENAYAANVPISFSSKGASYGSYFMPLVGQLMLMVTTSYGRKFVIASSCIVDNSSEQYMMPGENMIVSETGSFLKQDSMGNHLISSASGNMAIYNDNLVNIEVSAGKETRTCSGVKIEGFALEEGRLLNGILKGNIVKPVKYESYVSAITSINSYSSEEILINGEIQNNIKNNIIQNANDAISKINNFISASKNYFSPDSNTLKDAETLESDKQAFKANVESNFKLNKNVNLVIQKGNVVSKEIKSIEDINDLTENDYIKSEENNPLVFKIAVLNPTTKEEKAVIAIDSEGNGYMKFNNLTIETSGTLKINGEVR